MADSPKVRVREPQRDGQKIVFEIREDSLPLEHPARLLWEMFGRMDLSAFMAGAKAVEGRTGGSLKSRRMLLTLWGYAFTRGIVHAREIERLLTQDVAFQWIVGNLHVSHTLLSEFLVEHLEAMQTLFTNVLASLLHQGLIFLPEHRAAQDGTRVEANASIASFRTHAGLDVARRQAELHLKAVLARMDEPPVPELQQQARERGAMDVLDRIEQATEVVEELQEKRSECRNLKRKNTAPKASTTDPDARIMKMPNGGFDPAHNVQLVVLGSPMGGPVTIIGVEVTSLGSDKGSLVPMSEQVERRTGHKLDAVLVDAEHLTHEELREMLAQQRTVIAPVPERWELSEAPQDPAIAAWIGRMTTDEMRQEYRARKSLVERVNAILKGQFGLRQAPVRGTSKVLSLFLLATVTANLVQHGLKLLT